MKITTLTERRKTIFEKIMSRVKINSDSGCWEWQGPTSGTGRGEGYHFDSESRRGTYALPTKGHWYHRFMTLDQVQTHTQKFMSFAHGHKGLMFQVTQVGCGLGGFSKEDIAPLFEYAAYEGSNCYFDESWKDLLPHTAKFWGTYE